MIRKKTAKLLGFAVILGTVLFLLSSQVGFRNTYYSYQDVIRLKIHKIYRNNFINNTNDYYFEKNSIVDTLELPTLDLLLSKNDLTHFEKLYKAYLVGFDGVNYSEEGKANYIRLNKWKKAKLVFDNDTFRIKIRSHGWQPDRDIIGEYISFRIKLQDGKLIRNAKTFKLLIYDCMKYKSNIIDYLANEFSVIRSKQNELLKVNITGKKAKLYYLEQLTNDKVIETNSLPSYHIFSCGNNKSCIITRDASLDKFNTDLDCALNNSNLRDSLKSSIEQRFEELNTKILEQDYKSALEYFDLEYASSYLATRYIGNFDGHEQLTQNSIIYYNFEDQKFYPTINREPFLHGEIQDIKNIEKHFFHRRHEVLRDKNVLLLLVSFLARNDSIRNRAYEKTYDFIERKGSVFNDYWFKERLFSQNLYPSNVVYNVLAKSILEYEYVTDKNLEILTSYFSNAKPQFGKVISKNKVTIVLQPNSASSLMFNSSFVQRLHDSKKINKIHISTIATGLSESFHLTDSCCDITEILSDFSFQNGISNNGEIQTRTYLISFHLNQENESELFSKELNLVNKVTGETHVAIYSEQLCSNIDVYKVF